MLQLIFLSKKLQNDLAKPTMVKQQGSALLMALFIIVILILLGGALVRVLSTSSESIAQEVIGTRAYAAANSAMQAELQKLFPLNGATSQCNSNFYDFSTSGTNVDGLYHCRARTSCRNYATHPVDGTLFYRLTSTGECGSSNLTSQSVDVVVSSRTIQVEARSL
ncbi:MAG: type II secretory pathway component [Colwellia sp.]|nr:type II secretory pathway component [Colwellia sp.]MCW8864968.1 type II secretory pathway component [Colwellia sp.]MCW9082152.1 type II secretory pathway component [Colwellia sp.]